MLIRNVQLPASVTVADRLPGAAVPADVERTVVESRTRSIVLRVIVIVLALAPLVVGSIWIYRASSDAFALQHKVRIAQNGRNSIMRLFLGLEDTVRGFAATGDPYFRERYERRHESFARLTRQFAAELNDLDVHGRGLGVVADEQQTYDRWTRAVAIPIVDGRLNRSQSAADLRQVDTRTAARMVADDRNLGVLLDDLASASDVRRQTLLGRILVASVALVIAAAAILAALVEIRAAAARRELRHTVLYEEERRVTTLLQTALVPDRLPRLESVELSAIYVPAALERQVGGDWYEALELGDGRVLLLIGDVAGHGLDAAVIMNRARQAILGAIVRADDPARILSAANSVITSQSAGMVTAACCIFDPQTMLLTYATAGHPPPIVAIPGGTVRAMRTGGAPLGIVDDPDVQSYRWDVSAGSLVVLYTDGVTEDQLDVVQGETALLAAVDEHRAAPDPAQAIFASLFESRRPRDDVAIITMRV